MTLENFLWMIGPPLALTIFLMTTVIILIWYERRLIAFFQIRLGPNRLGPGGILQPVADAIKVLLKEDIVPKKADALLFFISPVLVFIPALLAWAVVPFGAMNSETPLLVSHLGVGIFFILAIASVTTVALVMGGWASNNKYSLLGGMRAAAQAISYEVPLVLSLVGVVMATGSLSLVDIVEKQTIWNIFLHPIACFVFFTCGLAEVNRLPFDLPEAESELVSGYNTEYSGFKFALFFLAEYVNSFLISALVVLVFLGGWRFPFDIGPLAFLSSGPLGVLIFLVKTYLVFGVIVWIRATLPRLRADRLMVFGWKVLLPLSLFNILATGLLIKLTRALGLGIY